MISFLWGGDFAALEFSTPPVGRGLKVNRPKAERSHPGVCPRRR